MTIPKNLEQERTNVRREPRNKTASTGVSDGDLEYHKEIHPEAMDRIVGREMLNWREFLVQLDQQATKLSDTTSRRTTKIEEKRGFSRLVPFTPSRTPRHTGGSDAGIDRSCIPEEGRLFPLAVSPQIRSPSPASIEQSEVVQRSRSPWMGKKRNSNVKNLSLNIAASKDSTIQLTHADQSAKNRKSQKLPAAVSDAARVVEKDLATGQTGKDEHTPLSVYAAPDRLQENSSSSIAATTQNDILAQACQSNSKPSALNNNKVSTPLVHKSALDYASTLLMNPHIPPQPPQSPAAVQAAKEELDKFDDMLSSFVNRYRTHKKQLIQHLSANSKAAEEEAQPSGKESAPTHVGTLETNSGSKLSASHAVEQKEDIVKATSSSQSAAMAFAAMKQSIARISQDEAYSRSYNAARNFSSNVQAGPYSKPDVRGSPSIGHTNLSDFSSTNGARIYSATNASHENQNDSSNGNDKSNKHVKKSISGGYGDLTRSQWKQKSRNLSTSDVQSISESLMSRTTRTSANVRTKILAGIALAGDLIIPHDITVKPKKTKKSTNFMQNW